jgi:hypothetical protein
VDAITRFREIIANGKAAFGPFSGAPEVVPFGAALVDLIRSFPAEREAFEREFKENVQGAPSELVEFCMHALRWESLRVHFEQCRQEAVSRSDWNSEPYYRHVLEAFDDEWPDAEDFYASYFRAGTYPSR